MIGKESPTGPHIHGCCSALSEVIGYYSSKVSAPSLMTPDTFNCSCHSSTTQIATYVAGGNIIRTPVRYIRLKNPVHNHGINSYLPLGQVHPRAEQLTRCAVVAWVPSLVGNNVGSEQNRFGCLIPVTRIREA